MINLAPVLRAYALIMVPHGADADDLVQDTLERAWKARGQYQPGTSMKAWLFTILRNCRHNNWRRSRRLVEDPNGYHASTLHSEASQGWRVEFAEVLTAMASLDADSRQALLLITAGLTYEETASVCRCNLRTVQSRVRRARKRLAELALNQYEDESAEGGGRTGTGCSVTRGSGTAASVSCSRS